MNELFPIFLKLQDRRVLVVGGGPVAAGKAAGLVEAGAAVTVVAPEVCEAIQQLPVSVGRRAFRESDLDGTWLVVAAAPPDVNRAVLEAASARQIFVNAVDDPAHATAYAASVITRGPVTLAFSTSGLAPALAGLLREALDDLLPADLDAWVAEAIQQRVVWKRDGIPMEARRGQLLERLNEIYRKKTGSGIGVQGSNRTDGEGQTRDLGSPIPDPGSLIPDPVSPNPYPRGFVSLVGAGPGDPDLWTVKATRRIAEADVVYYDALADGASLQRMTNARCFCVGKRAGEKGVCQETIHKLLIRTAGRGKRVVRLKCGDPFVFGRGAEEAIALASAGIPFDVIPGVSSAIAAPALAGIPVTHRGIASGVLVVSGHHPDVMRTILDGVRPNRLTVVVLMGVARRRQIVDSLLARGWAAATPTAVVLGAGTAGQTVWTGRLEELPAAEVTGLPGVIVVGEVVGLRDIVTKFAADEGISVNEAGGVEVRHGRQ